MLFCVGFLLFKMMKLLSYSLRSEKKHTFDTKKAFNFKRQPRLHALLHVQSAQEEPRLEMDSASRRLVRKGEAGHLTLSIGNLYLDKVL